MAKKTAKKEETGTISVQMENIFPIIKKWLYSEKDIFIRELISNSMDAILKLKHLAVIGEFKGLKEEKEYFIEVKVDRDKGSLSVSDNGIGMTAEEVKKYINEVAFSSARDFLDKYKTGDEGSHIIGHFGLGFYSSFMVSRRVEIDTLSYHENAKAVKWSCDGSPEYTLGEGTRKERGTEVTLLISDDEKEFLEPVRVRHIIKTYCEFLPVKIKMNGEVLNNKRPLWLEKPAELKDEDYKDFYRYLYPFEEEPLFWIHINIEYPVRAKGILYFPKRTHELDPHKGKIKFYYNQVYVSDNLKDLIPEFLTNLRGAIDCPDMPLNVSRSYLQSDPTMKKLSNHITKKVSDELIELFKNDKERYLKYWEDINPFIKFGMITHDKFYDQVKNIIVFKSTKGDYATIKEYLERNKEVCPGKVYYTSDEIAQSSYLNIFKEQNIEVLFMKSVIDSHFIQFLEMKDHTVKFARIDSETCDQIVDKEAQSTIIDPKTNKTMNQVIEDIFTHNLNIPKLTVKVENLKSEEVPAMIIIGEHLRRIRDISLLLQRKPEEDLGEHTLVVNGNNAVIRNLKKMSEMIVPPQDEIKLLCENIYDLALLTQKTIGLERLERFIGNSHKILQILSMKILG